VSVEHQPARKRSGKERLERVRRPRVNAEYDESEDPGASARPAIPLDNVHFTLTAPLMLPRDSYVDLRFWAHHEGQRNEVMKRARQVLGVGELDPILAVPDGPFPIKRGAQLSVFVSVEGIEIAHPHKPVWWTGEIGSAGFLGRVPANAGEGPHCGSMSVRVNDLETVVIDFVLMVGKSLAETAEIATRTRAHKNAFASYSSKDRDDIVTMVQGMEAAQKSLSVFVDVESLRAGQNWEQELKKAIAAADVMYLFWCRHSAASEWVRKEWQWALEARGLPFIDPVPLEDPQLAPPPPELASKHFNDRWLAFRRTHGETLVGEN
jgi:hypothetical protein